MQDEINLPRKRSKMNAFNLNRVNHFCLRKQHLTDDSKIDDLIQIVDDIGGLHATGSITPYLSLFIRSDNFTRDALNREIEVKRTLGKIRCMRRTMHVLTQEMLPVYYQATKKLIQPRFLPYLGHIGMTGEQYQKTSKLILDLLRGEAMSTPEIKKALQIDKNKNVSGIVSLMCDQGLLIRGLSKGGWKSNSNIYRPFKDHFPDVDLNEVPEAKARRLLVRKYLDSFSPVTEKDISWWSGLQKTQVRQALEELGGEIIHLSIRDLGGDFIMLCSDEEEIKKLVISENKVVNLLPAQDPYIMGYKDRERYLDSGHYPNVFDRSGNATSTIMLDGRVIGVWDYRGCVESTVKLFLFKEVEGDVLESIYSRAEEIGGFISDNEVRVKECDSMVPLTKRTAGGFMSPLRGC
jgi:hypothetical protein